MENEEQKEEYITDVGPEVTPVEPVFTTSPVEEAQLAQQVQEKKQEEPQIKTEPTQPVQTEKPKSNKKKKLLIILVTLLVIVSIGGYFIYNKILLDENRIINREIEAMLDGLETTIDTMNNNTLDYDLEKEAIGVNGSLSFKSDYKDDDMDLTKLANYQINYGGVIDKKNNQASLELSLNNQKTSIIDVSGYLNGKTTLINLGDLFDKVIKLDTDTQIKDITIAKTASAEDIKKVTNKTEQIIKDNIKESNVYKTKEEKTINGKKAKYTKVSYVVKTKELVKNILNGYLNDDEILNILTDLSGQTKSDLTDFLNDAVKELESSESDDEIIMNIYLGGLTAETKEMDFIYNTTNYNDVAEEYKLVIESTNDGYNYTGYVNDKSKFGGAYQEKNKTLTLDIQEENQKYNVSITKDGDTTKANINIKQDKTEFDITMTSTNKVESNSQTNDTKVDVVYKDSEDNIKFSINNNIEINKNAKVKEIKGTNAVNGEKLTDQQSEAIYNKLLEKLSPIIEDISSTESTSYFREILGSI